MLHLQPGTVLADRYVIEREVGRGGMGIVAAAHDRLLRRSVAVKVATELAEPSGSKPPPVAVERFLREARAAAQLRSEHVAKVIDLGQSSDGTPFLVMELLEGVDLASYLRSHGPVPAEQAIAWVLQAVDALAEAHAKGIVHRDVK